MKTIINLTTIDFTKPWWRVILAQKKLASLVLISVILRDIFWAMAPFIIAYVLELGNWYYFAATCCLWILAEINIILQTPIGARFQLQCIHSVFYSAHQYLLTVDPQYHVKRSSGIILAKIDRAARGYEEVLDQITYEFAPLFIGVTTMIIILSQYSTMLVAGISTCIITMLTFGYYFAVNVCQKQEQNFIRTDDCFRSTAFENLAQVSLIRTTFATDYMKEKLTEKIQINSQVERKLWLTYSFASRVLSMLYTISILMLLGFFVFRIKHNLTSLPFAIGLILAYIQSTKQLIKILHPFRKYMRGYAAIKNLFEFMPQFGKSEIPVFQNDQPIVKTKQTTIEVKDLVFNYGDAQLFNLHNLKIEAGLDQQNKLYGIIGPSGVGKTTLLSILGGQLKPLAGEVLIDGINIYQVGDNSRRQLITLQGQIASSVKGTIRYNLLFGLPENHGYSDEYLLDVLKRVGLERVIAEHKDGLDTLLGEGALNISGGQRQRLNFAGLYLRAYYYKPALILIDEPTSSLDEISELAVTEMISELARFSVTLVIAHRLKTLKNAMGLIDLSLLSDSNDIKIYKAEELFKISKYYHQLLEEKKEVKT